MEKRYRKENSSQTVERRIFHFRHHDAMCIVRIPDVVVLKTVDVHVQAIRVHVHVRDVELYDEPSESLPIYRAQEIWLNFIWDEEVYKLTAPTEIFCLSEYSFLFCKP